LFQPPWSLAKISLELVKVVDETGGRDVNIQMS